MKNEIWNDIPGFEGYYQASTLGNIRSVDRTIMRNDGVVITIKSVTLSPCANRRQKGRKRVNLSKGGVQFSMLVSRLIADTFLGKCPLGFEVDHIDENPANDSVDNLRYLSRYENASRSTKGKFRKQDGNKMEYNPKSKIVIGYTNGKEVVRYKCAKYLSSVYNINYSTIRHYLQNGGITINNIFFKYGNNSQKKVL